MNESVSIQLKRIFEPVGVADGFRIFVDKYWPRGVKKENLSFDIWAKNIVPSDALRRYFHEDIEGHWDFFKTAYQKELETSDALQGLIADICRRNINQITLLYASRYENRNHAMIIREVMSRLLEKSL